MPWTLLRSLVSGSSVSFALSLASSIPKWREIFSSAGVLVPALDFVRRIQPRRCQGCGVTTFIDAIAAAMSPFEPRWDNFLPVASIAVQ